MNDSTSTKLRPASAAPAPTAAQSKAATPPSQAVEARSAERDPLPDSSRSPSPSSRPHRPAPEQAKSAADAESAPSRRQPPAESETASTDGPEPTLPVPGSGALIPATEPPPPEANGSTPSRLPVGRIAVGVGLLLVFVVTGLGVYWTIQPDARDVLTETRAAVGNEGTSIPPGTATVTAVIAVAQSLLDKPGGYLSNDMTPPGVLMDNMPAWEYGVLTELRDTVRSLRNDFSRSQTQSIENGDLKTADSQFNFDSESWLLPSAEDEYRAGIDALEGYRDGLIRRKDPSARFYARADNLGAYLAVVEKRLGSLAQRLAASVGDNELTAALAGAPSVRGLPRTAWDEIDDVFYEARGYTWALLHTMQALSVDFAEVLEDKNAQISMQQVIRDLEGATTRKWSPLVLNGHGYGLLANHSLVMASYVSRTNAAVLDLRVLLQQG